MADVTITELNSLTAYASTTVIPADSGIQTYKMSRAVVAKGLQSIVAGFDAVVGSGDHCTHANIAAALADAALTTNKRILVTASETLAATLAAAKAGWHFVALPGVTLTAGAATVGFTVTAAKVKIEGFNFSGFATGVQFNAGGENGRVIYCNFATVATNVNQTGVTAYPLEIGSITE